MKVIDYNNTTHTILIVPRRTVSGTIEMYIDELPSQEVIYLEDNQKITFNFQLDAKKDQQYAFKLMNNGEVLYRGLLFATDQEPQNYDQNNGIFTWKTT